ncbi:MAG: hypothetical protein NVS9B2_27860 [Steroidobacteraceae bacterium]
MGLNRGSVLMLVAVCAGCGGPANVIPLEGGLYQVIASDGDKDDARREAVKEARKGCIEQKGKLVVMKIDTEYKGLFSEEKTEKIDQVGASIPIPIPIPLFRPDREYHVVVTFRCD